MVHTSLVRHKSKYASGVKYALTYFRKDRWGLSLSRVWDLIGTAYRESFTCHHQRNYVELGWYDFREPILNSDGASTHISIDVYNSGVFFQRNSYRFDDILLEMLLLYLFLLHRLIQKLLWSSGIGNIFSFVDWFSFLLN